MELMAPRRADRRSRKWTRRSSQVPACSGYWVAVDDATGDIRAVSGSPYVLAVLIQRQGLHGIRIVCVSRLPWDG